MAIRREVIEALLRVKDQARFKTSMKGAAKAVHEVGDESEDTARRMKVLTLAADKLEREAAELRMYMRSLARAEDDAGDEAVQLAAKMGVLRGAMRGVGGGLPLLSKRWSFWKDRLSLTAGEVKSVALTMGTYLSPALIELGASASAAALGGVIVGGGGLAALVVGLGGAGLIASQASAQFKKVTTAQDAYNLAVAQYGKGSKQAAAASARLYGVISTQGGRPVWQAVKAVDALRNAWTATTGGARRSIFGIITSGVGGLRRLLPTFARETNANTGALRGSLSGAFRALSGGEMRRNITLLSATFRAAQGPGIRGGTNLFLVIGRVLTAAGPWVVRWADSWERWTFSLRRSTRDQSKVEHNVAMLVGHFQAWWGLAKSLGTTLRILFRGSTDEGRSLVLTITGVVDKFNLWLDRMERSGRLRGFFRSFNDSLRLLFTDPQEFANRAAQFFARAAAHAGGAFIKAWWSLDWPHKLFIAALMFRGAIFGTMGRLAAAFFISAFAPRLAAAMAAQGVVGSGLVVAAGGLGAAFATALVAAAGPLIAVGLAHVLQNIIEDATGKKLRSPGDALPGNLRGPSGDRKWKWLGDSPWDTAKNLAKKIPGFATGGTILPGQLGLVGERGPELAISSPRGGTIISPLGSGAAALPSTPAAIDLAGMAPLPPIHVHLDVNGREIARAYIDDVAARTSRRGGRKPLQ